jgi:hypothetical protein
VAGRVGFGLVVHAGVLDVSDPICQALTELGIFQLKEEDLLPWYELARYWRQGE